MSLRTSDIGSQSGKRRDLPPASPAEGDPGSFGHLRLDPRLLDAADPGTARGRQDHLAIALGVRAVENGFSVAFFRLEELPAALKRDADLSPGRLRRRKYNHVALVLLDEIGSGR